MTQYGFYFDQSRCIGCSACEVACEQWHDIAPGYVKWMRIYQWEKGSFPNLALNILAISCYHCENPVCIKACPERALYKEEKYGAVLVNRDQCQGKRKCWMACPYGVPQYEGNAPGLKMSKCNMCIDRLEQGLAPICVLSCSMRALEFGTLDELKAKYGTLGALPEMPKASITRPAVVFKPVDPKRTVVPWDAARALELWQHRQPHNGEALPEIFASISDVTNPSEEIIGRNRLVLKAKSVEEMLHHTMDDE